VGRCCILFVALPVLALIAARLALNSSGMLRMKVAVQLMGWDGVGEIAREAIAQRWIGQKSTASRTEFLDLLDTLAEADAKYLSPTGRGVVHNDDIAEGHVFLTHLLRTGLTLFMEIDKERPQFRRYVTADRKILGDNPDAIYYGTNLDPDLAYVVRGKVTSEDYLSLTIMYASCEGCFFKDSIADVNDRQLNLTADREFTVLLSAKRPSAWTGDWLSLTGAPEGSTLQLLMRHYYEREVSIAADPLALMPVLAIARADAQTGAALPVAGAAPPSEANVAQKLRIVKTFIKKHTTEFVTDPATAPKWFSFTPNVFGDPTVVRDASTGDGQGAVDIAYSAGPFKLAPDEALLIEGIMPQCAFGNIVLWNRFLQSFDYVTRRTSLNRKQMNIGTDGSFKIALAHSDPGGGWNWLDTMGREGGTMFWRFLLPNGTVQTPKSTVVKFSELVK